MGASEHGDDLVGLRERCEPVRTDDRHVGRPAALPGVALTSAPTASAASTQTAVSQ